MCESYDVLKSTYQSATAMTYTLCDYGGGNMGLGIRKFADNMVSVGMKEGIKKGLSLGACEGYKIGFTEGHSVGFLEGSVITTVALGVLTLSVWGVDKICKKINETKKIDLKNKTSEQEEFCNAEVQSNF